MSIRATLRHSLLIATLGAFGIAILPALAQKTMLVTWQHTMREMFTTGDISGKVPLAPLQKTPHLYAVGPGENLRSELLVWNGVLQESRVTGGKADVRTVEDARAVFLVYAYVPKWRSISVPSSVKTSTELLPWIKKTARENGLPPDEPFPFLLTGVAKQADYHIVDTPDDGTPFTREKHDKYKWHATLRNEAVEILGFYSEKHAGVFVHHSAPAHLHLRSKNGKAMGHLDGFVPGAGMTLFLPDSGGK